MRRIFVSVAVWVAISFVFGELAVAQSLTGRKVNINEDWKYLEKDIIEVSKLPHDSRWVGIDLPHSWNSEDATDVVPGYRRSASWYKKELDLQPEQGKRYFLYFEGANLTTDVYVNGRRAGGHVGGYIGFDVELTEFLSPDSNEVLVRVDNSYNREVIPSNKSDFFVFGGITRDVWLKTVPTAFVSRIMINTPSVSAIAATADITVRVNPGNESAKGYSMQCVVTDPEGNSVYEAEQKIKSFDRLTFSFDHPNPQLWHVDAPNLYQVSVTLLKNGKPVDQLSEQYGYRWFEFEEHGAFYLNGERLLLRGTHRHEEHAGYGAAMPNELHIRDMQMIKEMGANFVRLGHYPQDPEVYKACDQLGIIVWDELPWCRGGVGNEAWKENTRNMFREMIDQNRNHPSVVFWSLGNEIYWLPDFEDGDNVEKLNAFLRELNDIAHEMDPSRLTTIRKYYEGSDITDVFSPSIWSGWYSGNYKNYENALSESMKQYKHFIHAEYGGSSHVGRHSENPITGEGTINPEGWEEPINQAEVKNIARYGDWSENYIVDLFDWHLKVSESLPGFAGNAQWAFKDFGTPLRPENDIPYMNQKGLVDREGNPKDAYYVFKSYWAEDPFCYIESHTWTERSGPEGVARNISVFSNADEVEFFHNDQSLGRKVKNTRTFPASGLNWDVHFSEGANRLKAIGYVDGQEVSNDTLTVNYSFEKHGSPDDLALTFKTLENGNLLIEAYAVDTNGRRCLDYEEKVYFQCLSGGTTRKSLGTPTGSEVIGMSNGRAAIEVVPDRGVEEVVMTVLNQDFKGSFLKIPLKVTP